MKAQVIFNSLVFLVIEGKTSSAVFYKTYVMQIL